MRVRALALTASLCFAWSALHAFQKPFREYPAVEYNDWPLPDDWKQPAEWTFARLMFPGGPLDGYYPRFQGDYHKGLSLWTQDYPKADRLFARAVARLSRIDARSVEQVIDIEDGDDVYNWPFLYAVQAGEWGLTEKQARILRDYLDRGGFFLADDIHGTDEWAECQKRLHFAYPDAQIEDVPDDDALFHTVYDMSDRIQVPGQAHVRLGYKNNGRVPGWLGIRDAKKRWAVTIALNSDWGDGWEFADIPQYPEKFSAMAIRMGVNYAVYSMTH
jgi:hypothetical protein